MDASALRRRIEHLDSRIHGALVGLLVSKLNHDATDRAGGGTLGEDMAEVFARMFGEAIDRLNTRYISGTIAHMRKHQPRLHMRIKQSESDLEELWSKGLEGRATVQDFGAAIEHFCNLHYEGIRAYSQELRKKASPDRRD